MWLLSPGLSLTQGGGLGPGQALAFMLTAGAAVGRGGKGCPSARPFLVVCAGGGRLSE